MNIRNSIIILVLISGLSFCKTEKEGKRTDDITQNNPSDLEVDHLNIWVEDPIKAKEQLVDIGFTAVPDSLSKIHKGQGTAGRYFNFLNGYLELIFVYDQMELEENNAKNKDLDFTERANFEKNGASPFSIALKIKDYQIEKIPFEKVGYQQDWVEENASLFSAINSKTHLSEPSIFVVYPEIEADIFESLTALENTPTEDDFWKDFFRHPNGAKKVSGIIITSPEIDLKTETVRAVNGIEKVIVKQGTEHLMELYFDKGIQGKSFDLRPKLPLIVNL